MEFTRPRGTRDFLFEEMKERKQAESTLRKVFESYGYQEIKTPLFSFTAIFFKSLNNSIERGTSKKAVGSSNKRRAVLRIKASAIKTLERSPSLKEINVLSKKF